MTVARSLLVLDSQWIRMVFLYSQDVLGVSLLAAEVCHGLDLTPYSSSLGLGFTVYPRLASDLQKPTCLCLTSVEIKGACHHVCTQEFSLCRKHRTSQTIEYVPDIA